MITHMGPETHTGQHRNRHNAVDSDVEDNITVTMLLFRAALIDTSIELICKCWCYSSDRRLGKPNAVNSA